MSDAVKITAYELMGVMRQEAHPIHHVLYAFATRTRIALSPDGTSPFYRINSMHTNADGSYRLELVHDNGRRAVLNEVTWNDRAQLLGNLSILG